MKYNKISAIYCWNNEEYLEYYEKLLAYDTYIPLGTKLNLRLFPHFINSSSIPRTVGLNWRLFCHGIQLASLLSRDELVGIYTCKFGQKIGARAKNPQVIIGAFIIKHKLVKNIKNPKLLKNITLLKESKFKLRN